MRKIRLIPHNRAFYDLFEQSIENTRQASEKLVDLFDHYEDVRTKTTEIKSFERKGDEITHRIMENLHRSFVTPLDREDIARLASCLDDMMDYLEGATKRMYLYRIRQPTPRAIEISYIINKVAKELCMAVPLLRDHSQMKGILTRCINIHSLENEADDLRHAALADLFEEEKDVKEILKWLDVYQNLENAVDRGEDVANILEGIVLKNA